MKSIKTILAAFLTACFCLVSCKTDEIFGRLDKLEQELSDLSSNKISSIEKQISAILVTIPKLEETDANLKIYIENLQKDAISLQEQINSTEQKISECETSLRAEFSVELENVLKELQALKNETEQKLEALNATITSLQEKDAEIETKIDELKAYVDNLKKETIDWSNATFSTIEQYNSLCDEIAAIKLSVGNLNTELRGLISELETSMKGWVNEQLSGYMTIAEAQAKYEALSLQLEKNESDVEEALKEIEAMKEDIAKSKEELTTAYTKAISDAIESYNGVIESKIAAEIATVNQKIKDEIAVLSDRIDAIEKRLSDIEGRLDALECIKKIQTITFLPEYDDGKAYIYTYRETIKFDVSLQIRPSEYAEKLVEAFNSGKTDFLFADVLPVEQTKAAQIPVTLPLTKLILISGGVVKASFDASIIDIEAIINGTQSYMCSFYAQYEDAIASSPYVRLGGGILPTNDLSKTGTANCYIVNDAGDYKFDCSVKGNSAESVGSVASAEVLWESFGTDVTPNVGDIINNVSYADGYVLFSTPASLNNGNAVIAVKDASGNILWSWHIWVCDGYDPVVNAQVYNNVAGTMMDRNLGATSATKGDVHALGLLYQWGRKDPFLSGDGIKFGAEMAASTLATWPSAANSYTNGTIDYAVAHPTTFIGCNSHNDDWYYTGDSSTDDTRWNSSKGVYDPCPTGWRVPDGGSTGVWTKAFGTSDWWATASNWDSTNKGIDFGSTDKTLGSGTIWYPAAGLHDGYSPESVGRVGFYWSCSPNGSSAYYLYFFLDGSVSPSSSSYREFGRSVRCLRE